MDIPKNIYLPLLVKQGRMETHLTQEALAEKLGNIGGLSWRPRTP